MVKIDPQERFWPKEISASDCVFCMFDTVGDGTGETEMATASNVYKMTPPRDEKYRVCCIGVYIESDEKLKPNMYMPDASLLNGIDMTINNTSGSVVRLTPEPITKIGHWYFESGEQFQASDQALIIQWKTDIVVDGHSGEFLKVTVQDDLSELVSHLMRVRCERVYD
jgi:hypothetical protein